MKIRYIVLFAWLIACSQASSEVVKNQQSVKDNDLAKVEKTDTYSEQKSTLSNQPKELTEEQQADVDKLLDRLEEDDDVQNVFHTMA